MLHFKNNDNFLMDDFWKDLTIVTTLFFLLPFEFDSKVHGLRTPNEGINQRYLKNWADVADKICCRHT